MSLSVLTNPATEVATGKISKWIAANNPILFTAVRKDHEFDSVSNTSGKLNIIFNGVDKTADFLANDKIYVKSDDGTYNEAGTVTSSSFSTNTTVATSIDYTSSSGGGYANNNTQRANYVVEVDIKKISDDTSLLTNKPQLETFTDGTINITLGKYISSQVNADHGFDFSTSTAIDSNGVFHFYCTFLEVWDSSSETAVTAIHSTQKLSNNEFASNLSDWTNSGSGTAWTHSTDDSGSAKVDTTPAGNTQILMQDEDLFKGLAYVVEFELGDGDNHTTIDVYGRLASDSSTAEIISADVSYTDDTVVKVTFVASKNYDQFGFRATSTNPPDQLLVNMKYYNLYEAVTLSAVMATKQIGETYGQNLGEFVPWSDGTPAAKFLTKMTSPVYDTEYPFTIGFIYDNNLGENSVIFEDSVRDQNGTLIFNRGYEIPSSQQGELVHMQLEGFSTVAHKESVLRCFIPTFTEIAINSTATTPTVTSLTTTRVGQTFTTTTACDGIIARFTMLCSTPLLRVELVVTTTSSGLPTDTVLGKTEFFPDASGAQVVNSVYVEASLSNATVYAVYLRLVEANGTFTTYHAAGNPYSGGQSVSFAASTWTGFPTLDGTVNIDQVTADTVITETKTVTVSDPCQDKFTLLWRNSLGGFSQWTFTDTQEVTFTEEDRQKFKDFLTSATNVTVNQLEALDEMQRPGDVVKEGFFLLASQTRTHKKIGQAIYELSTSGGKTGVIILNEPTTYKTSDTNADFQILVRKPEIL